MATWTRADVIAVAPEMTPVDPAVVDFWITQADDQIDSTIFGSDVRAKLAGCYLTAHFLKTTPGILPGSVAGASGAIQSTTVGRVSVTFANAVNAPGSGVPAWLSTSAYGIQFSRLVKLACVTPIVL